MNPLANTHFFAKLRKALRNCIKLCQALHKFANKMVLSFWNFMGSKKGFAKSCEETIATSLANKLF